MLAMAKSPPTNLAALKEVKGVGSDQAERRGKDILEAVQRGLAVPEQELPRIERPPRRPQDPAYEARVERLKAVRNALAIQYDLAPGVLCPNGSLEAIARVNPSSLKEMGEIRELRRWQIREIGDALLAAARQPPRAAT
jgi:ribonuclease D